LGFWVIGFGSRSKHKNPKTQKPRCIFEKYLYLKSIFKYFFYVFVFVFEELFEKVFEFVFVMLIYRKNSDFKNKYIIFQNIKFI